jgi:hypothetical protein
MPLAVLTTDDRWYHVDVYERRGTGAVKTASKAFRATPDAAAEVFSDTASEYPLATLVKYVWDPRGKRWQRVS